METPTTEPVCVGVIEGDFYVRPERTTFQVGQPYVFAVGNEGAAVHEFVIEPAGKVDEPLEAEVNGEERESEIEDIAPGETDELEWTFTEPGRYQFACHVPGHFEAGMVIEVEVVAEGISARRADCVGLYDAQCHKRGHCTSFNLLVALIMSHEV